MAENRKWANRIVATGEKPASQFQANPENFRLHPKEQRQALNWEFSHIGWVTGVIENVTTGHLIDGHARVEEALKNDDELVPFIQVKLTEKEERLILAALDETTSMAKIDSARLESIIKDVLSSGMIDDVEDKAMHELFSEMSQKYHVSMTDKPSSFDEVSSELPGVQALKDFMIFPSSLPYGIPELLPDKILNLSENCEVWVGPRGAYGDPDQFLYVWGSDSIKGLDLSKTVITFYTDDRRFESFWYDPPGYTAKLINAGVEGVFVPNFSMFPDAPEAMLIWQRYRSLWLGRYFQEAGLDVMPDLRTIAKYGKYNYIGIPKGVPVACQYQQGSISYAREIEETDNELEALQCPKVFIYADERGWNEFCSYSRNADKAVWLKNRVGVRRDYMNQTKASNPLRP